MRQGTTVEGVLENLGLISGLLLVVLFPLWMRYWR